MIRLAFCEELGGVFTAHQAKREYFALTPRPSKLHFYCVATELLEGGFHNRTKNSAAKHVFAALGRREALYPKSTSASWKSFYKDRA